MIDNNCYRMKINKAALHRATQSSLACFSLLCLCVGAAQASPNANAGAMFPDNSPAALSEVVSGVANDSFGTTTTLTYIGNQNDTVPALLVIPAGASTAAPVPCVILIHGVGMNKEQMLPIARLLSNVGYASLTIDLPGYGARSNESRSTFNSSDDFAQYLAAGFTRAVTDLRRGLDLLDANHSIDSTRIGVMGLSLGSFVAVDFAAADPRVKAVALIASGGGLSEILSNQASRGVSYGGHQPTQITQLANSRSANATLATVDPITYVAEIAPRPILMQNGGADPIVPISAAKALYRAAGQPKHIDIYPDEGHIPSPLEMYVPLTQFLAHNLPQSSSVNAVSAH